jgi:MRG-binding protein
MHKHFRMLAIHDYMTSQGVVNPADEHTKIPGIWQKLGSLYSLPNLDDREDSIMNDLPDENGEVVELYSPFSLPEGEYGPKMFARRLDPEGSKSPDEDPSRRESTVADTDEPGSSPAPGRRLGRKARTPARAARVSKLQREVDGSRRTSKATSVNEDDTMEDLAEDADGVESDEDAKDSAEEGDPGNARTKRRKIAQGRGGTGRGSARRSARKSAQ